VALDIQTRLLAAASVSGWSSPSVRR
jgi:hypothetical protein